MDSVIRIEFILTFADYLRFQRYYARRRLRLFRAIAILALMWVLLVPLIPRAGNQSVSERYLRDLPILILPILVFVLLPISIYFTTKKRWKAATDMHEPRIYEFSDTGMSVTGKSYQGSTIWDNIPRAETAGPMILLFSSQKLSAHLIPLDAIGDPQKAEAFKTLIRQKVPDCRRLR